MSNIMDHHHIGIACALGAAIGWAVSLIFFRLSGKHVPPLLLNFFKNTIALILFCGTLLVMGGDIEGLQSFSATDIMILMASGIIGITIADSLLFYSLNIIGVGLSSIVDCLLSPLVILWSFLLLSETLTGLQYAGAALIILSVSITTKHEPPPGISQRKLLLGIFLGILCRMLMAFGIVIAKPVLNDAPLIWATVIRLAVANIALGIVIAFSSQKASIRPLFRPGREWRYTIPGSVLGAYLAMVLWIAGYKYTFASLAAVLNQTTAMFAIILAAIFLKEKITGRKIVAVILALTGIVLVTL